MVLSSFEIDWNSIENAKQLKGSLNGTLLWVFNADRIPPHLGLSSEGYYYSLKVNGKDESVPVSRIIDLVEKKGIKTLIFELSDVQSFQIRESFSEYDKAKAGEVTCLDPIKKILNVEALTIHDLLFRLYADGMVSRVIGVNINSAFKGIPFYELEDIFDHLNALESVQE